MTLFDWVVIGVVGISALVALFRGLIREVLSLAAWILAAIGTLHFYVPAKAWVAKYTASSVIQTGVSTVGLFIGILILCSMVNYVILRLLRSGGELSVIDATLGMFFGAARGVFILALAYVMFAVVMPEDDFPDEVKNAKTRPVVMWGVNALYTLAPEYTERLAKMSKEAQKEGEAAAEKRLREQLEKNPEQALQYYEQSGHYDAMMQRLQENSTGQTAGR